MRREIYLVPGKGVEEERKAEWFCGELWNIGRSMAMRAKAEDKKQEGASLGCLVDTGFF